MANRIGALGVFLSVALASVALAPKHEIKAAPPRGA